MGEQAHGLDGQPRDRARGRAGKETPSRREPQTSFIQLDRVEQFSYRTGI